METPEYTAEAARHRKVAEEYRTICDERRFAFSLQPCGRLRRTGGPRRPPGPKFQQLSRRLGLAISPVH